MSPRASFQTATAAESRVAKLQTRFRQAQEDVGHIATSTEKISRRAARIDAIEFDDKGGEEKSADEVEARPNLRLAKGGE